MAKLTRIIALDLLFKLHFGHHSLHHDPLNRLNLWIDLPFQQITGRRCLFRRIAEIPRVYWGSHDRVEALSRPAFCYALFSSRTNIRFSVGRDCSGWGRGGRGGAERSPIVSTLILALPLQLIPPPSAIVALPHLLQVNHNTPSTAQPCLNGIGNRRYFCRTSKDITNRHNRTSRRTGRLTNKLKLCVSDLSDQTFIHWKTPENHPESLLISEMP